MGIETAAGVAGKAALEFVQNENVLNKTVGALGMLFPYAGITKKAVDMYIAEIEKSDMPIDAKMYAMMNAKKQLKQMKNQKQIAEIAMQNAKEGTSFTSDCGVSEEWLERFMDSAAYVSDENIQLIWGKILSNEFDNPGTTPPNMIRILSEMTPTYAKAFRQLCSMRLLIAQALLNDPDILIMDEPTAGLDPSERIRIRNFLSEMSENKIIIIATHIVSDIEFIAKEIILLSHGEIIEHGTPQHLLKKLNNKVYEVETSSEDEFKQENVMIVNIKMGANGKIYRIISESEPRGYNFSVVKAGLEELYMYYVSLQS